MYIVRIKFFLVHNYKIDWVNDLRLYDDFKFPISRSLDLLSNQI